LSLGTACECEKKRSLCFTYSWAFAVLFTSLKSTVSNRVHFNITLLRNVEPIHLPLQRVQVEIPAEMERSEREVGQSLPSSAEVKEW